MYEFDVATSAGSYPVRIGTGSLRAALAECSVVVIDEGLVPLLADLDGIVIPVAAGESTKTLTGCEAILVRMREHGVRRGDTLAAVGGGSIQDAATFVASFYMRGIPWMYCPTTAMSMADSCIGGKSSINVGGIKNLGGNIYPPRSVVVDPALADSLSLVSRIDGLAEAVKICFAAGHAAFDRYCELDVEPAEFGAGEDTERLLAHVLETKKWFIEVDEFDQAERQLLNFGHTFAHALESATNFVITHGVAVALGVLAALSHPGSASGLEVDALRRYCVSLLQPLGPGIGAAATHVNWRLFDEAILADKKGTRDSIRLVLPGSAGRLHMVSVPRDDSSTRAIRAAMSRALEEVAS